MPARRSSPPPDPAPGEPPGGSTGSSGAPSLGQALRVLGGLSLVGWGLFISSTIYLVPGSADLTVLLSVAGVGVMTAAFLPLNRVWLRRLDLAVIVVVSAAFAFWVSATVQASPGYGTDEIAFDQAAGELAAHGHNPYGADLSSSLDEYAVPAAFFSYRLDGGHVSRLSYPAMSFLPYVPLLALGLRAQAAVFVNCAFWAAAMLLLWRLLPERARPVVPILSSLGIFTSFAVGGLTDPLFVPLLLLALWRWDRYGRPEERSPARWMGPLALGLAMGVKQSVWLLAPFLLLGLVLERRGSGRRWWLMPLRYLAVALAAFLAPNLPFLLADPGAWLHGVLIPLVDPLVPFGQALVGLSTYLNLGGGNLALYTLSAGAAVLALVTALAGWYPQLKRVLPALPAVALLLPSRSLVSYLVYVVPGLLVAALSVEPGEALGVRLGRPLRSLAGTAGAAATALLVAAVATPSPLELAVTGEHETGRLQTFDQLHLHVSNRANHSVRPHFAVTIGQYMSSPWIVRRGPAVIAPRGSADYDLVAPNTSSMASVGGGFEVYAVSTSPAAISASPPYLGAEHHLQLLPQAVERLVSVGQAVELRARVLDRMNRPVPVAGMRLALGQQVNTQEGGLAGEASVNGQPEGQSPVTALTDSQGVGHFTIRGIQAQPYQVFFEAWIVGTYPQGYSNTVGIQFVPERPRRIVPG